MLRTERVMLRTLKIFFYMQFIRTAGWDYYCLEVFALDIVGWAK